MLPVIGGGDGAWRVRTPCGNEAVTAGEPLRRAHVVLDPGHGGEETGTVGATGLREADLNLAVAQRAAELLAGEGAAVVLTRETDVRVTIATRTELVRALQPLAFVSIHHNGGPTTPTTSTGAEVYFQAASDASARLAGLLHAAYEEAFAPVKLTWGAGPAAGVRARLNQEGGDFYGVLRQTAGTPSVLSEAAYLSNPDDERALVLPVFQEAEAQAIADAVRTFVATQETGTPPGEALVASESAGGGGTAIGCDDPPLA